MTENRVHDARDLKDAIESIPDPKARVVVRDVAVALAERDLFKAEVKELQRQLASLAQNVDDSVGHFENRGDETTVDYLRSLSKEIRALLHEPAHP